MLSFADPTSFVRADLLGLAAWTAAFIAAAFCFFPTRIVLGGAGFAFGLWGIPLAYVVAILTGCLQFLVGRALAGRWSARLLAKHRMLRLTDQVIGESGWQLSALARFTPLPFAVQNYGLSFSSMSLGAFALGTSLGMLLPVILWTGVGILGREVTTGSAEGWPVAVVVVSLVPVLVFAAKSRRRFKELSAAD